MNKFRHYCLLIPLLLSMQTSAATIEVVIENVGLIKPESVVHDSKNDVYLVSNINGSVAGPQGKGFISRISPDGEVLVLKWIDGRKDGVHHPTGLAIAGDVLYVADVREDGRGIVRLFDLDTGKFIGAAEHPPGVRSNSLAVLPNGDLLGTDSGWKWALLGSEEERRLRGTADSWRQWDGHLWLPTGQDSVYRIDQNLRSSALVKNPDLRHPNGIVALPNGNALVVSSTGGIFYELTPDGRQASIRTLPRLGFFDGIGVTPKGDILISHDKGIYRIEPNGQAISLFDFNSHVADFGFDLKRDRLLLPLIYANKVVVARIPDHQATIGETSHE